VKKLDKRDKEIKDLKMALLVKDSQLFKLRNVEEELSRIKVLVRPYSIKTAKNSSPFTISGVELTSEGALADVIDRLNTSLTRCSELSFVCDKYYELLNTAFTGKREGEKA
jgi:hypothetical protein